MLCGTMLVYVVGGLAPPPPDTDGSPPAPPPPMFPLPMVVVVGVCGTATDLPCGCGGGLLRWSRQLIPPPVVVVVSVGARRPHKMMFFGRKQRVCKRL